MDQTGSSRIRNRPGASPVAICKGSQAPNSGPIFFYSLIFSEIEKNLAGRAKTGPIPAYAYATSVSLPQQHAQHNTFTNLTSPLISLSHMNASTDPDRNRGPQHTSAPPPSSRMEAEREERERERRKVNEKNRQEEAQQRQAPNLLDAHTAQQGVVPMPPPPHEEKPHRREDDQRGNLAKEDRVTPAENEKTFIPKKE